MAKVDVVVKCESAAELDLVLRYLTWKGHKESDGTLIVDRVNMIATAVNDKEIDWFYMSQKQLEELPEPPVPPG